MVRITQNMMTRNYLRNLNTGISNLNSSQNKLTSGSRFNKTSENVSDAARALKVRQKLYDNEADQTAIRDADARLSSAESNLTSINDILVSAREKLMLKALNDTNGAQRENIAQEIDSLREQVLQFANAQFSDQYLFGGTNNGGPPFTEEDGEVYYNGIKADSIFYDETDRKYYYNEPVLDGNGDPALDGNGDPIVEKKEVPENGDVYLDVGLGVVMNGKDVDPRTAFKISFSGLEILGCGTQAEDGVPNNIFSLLKKASDNLREEPFDRTSMETITDKLKDETERMRLNLVDMGTRTQFLEKTTERLESDAFNLTSLQQKLEVTDQATESINWKVFTAAWMATLQFGSKVLPVSLMDYIQ